MRELLLAKRLASPDLRGFPNQWLSADIVSSIIDNAADESLYADSVAQGTVMYQSDVLRVYAADWRFQLVAKIARAHERGQLANDDHFGNDMSDTVAILRLLVEQNKGRPIRIADVRGWYALGRRLTDEELEHAEAAYEAVHGEHALAGESEEKETAD
ncbi:hypothetical protein EXIGLDRAFT_722787 [Exidia glandulosa HHB12029]|uniref:DUF7582 domain-containing protein n=1 Tax=Exidia glandulosa HHB12029 TaxID=1314781 RepID=A0A165F3W3_EXIGL|nr:hypothetical protein EXIGLDRAFT_722787 [Exidia glandulosa HHB12029]